MVLISRVTSKSSPEDTEYRVHTHFSETNPFYRMSNELWVEIGQHLRRRDHLRLMLVSPSILDIFSFLVYRTLTCEGSSGRKCMAMLASGKGNAIFYSGLVQELTFFAYEVADRYLSFQVLAKALRGMCRLRGIQLHIATFNSEFLLYCLRQEGHIKSSIRVPSPALSGLTRLAVNGSRILVQLGVHRKLEELDLTDFLDHEGLARVTMDLTGGLSGASLRTLRLRLHQDMEPGIALDMIDGACPNLHILSLEQEYMSAKNVRITFAL
ncbi:hypothetical protein CC2G_003466 [Coprinopsis cinerea AmutBmut pab1-1]|nr:hypothetical protein CC2G_003466 [Coprinopsis cinerea AmutBmut pab1-1]